MKKNYEAAEAKIIVLSSEDVMVGVNGSNGQAYSGSWNEGDV